MSDKQVTLNNVSKSDTNEKADSHTTELNICRVVCESHIDKILMAHRNTISMLIFCNYEPKINIFMKKVLAQKFNTCYFIIAALDKQNFVADTKKYVSQIVQNDNNNINESIADNLPCCLFFYDMKRIARIPAAIPQTINDAMIHLLKMKAEAQPKQTQQTQQTHQSPHSQQSQQNDQMMKMAREYQVEKIQEDRKMHELVELQKLDKIQKNTKKAEAEENNKATEKNNEAIDDDSEHDNDDDNDNNDNNDNNDDNNDNNDNDNDNNKKVKKSDKKSKTKKEGKSNSESKRNKK